MATIILTGGGTAGHCMPHLALLPYLKKDFDKIYYIGSESGIEKTIIENEHIPYYSIPCIKLKRQFSFDNLAIPFILRKGIKKAGLILDELKPDIIFSKGGYVSVPTVIASKTRKIPVISHESDYTVGLANKLTARLSKKVLTAFEDTAKNIKNGEYVGAPIRNVLNNSDKETALKYFNFKGNKPIVLVFGGSLGASIINQTIRTCLPDILPKFDVIHICGKNNVIKELEQKGYFQTEFLNEMQHAFSVASVCVSRAGSNSLFELLSLKIPSVIIPLPKGISRGDQVENAKYFQKLGLIFVLDQDVLTKDSLIYSINSVYANRFNIIRNFNKTPITDKSRQISRIIADYI